MSFVGLSTLTFDATSAWHFEKKTGSKVEVIELSGDAWKLSVYQLVEEVNEETNKIITVRKLVKEYTWDEALAAGYAKDQEGTLFVGSKDIKRDLSIFKTALQNKGIKVDISDVPLEEERGFVLKYGDIEYNLSLTAIINDKRDSLEDRIHQILFG